jgi:hypothetical protein
VLVKLEPVRQDSKHEEEYRQAKQKEASHDARGVPDLTRDRRNEVVPWQTEKDEQLYQRVTIGFKW